MMSSQWKIAIITNAIPQNGENMYRRLKEHNRGDLHEFCQDEIPRVNLNAVHEKLN